MKFYFIYIICLIMPFCIGAQNGKFYNDGATIKIEKGSNITLYDKTDYINDSSASNNATIDLDGHINISGHWYNNALNNIFKNIESIPDGIVIFNGTIQQTININSTTFENLGINSNHGIDAVKLNCNTSVSGRLFLYKNGINAKNKLLTLTNPNQNAIAEYDTNAYVIGKLRRYIDTGTYIFPIGSISYYEEINLHIIDKKNMNYITTEFLNLDPGIVPEGLEVGAVPITSFLNSGYWRITSNNDIAAVYDITATSRGHTNGGPSPEMHALFKRTDGGTWQNFGSHHNETQSGSGTSPITATRTNANNGLYEFAIGLSNITPLPINLLSINTECKNNILSINWTTVPEFNIAKFYILKSNDLKNWETIGIIKSQNNMSDLNSYSFNAHVNEKNGFIQLKQIDNDGKFKIFNTFPYYCSSNNNNIIIQNPIDNQIHLSLSHINYKGILYLNLWDIDGQLIFKNELHINKTYEAISINCSMIKPGVYTLTVNSSDNTISAIKKIVKQ